MTTLPEPILVTAPSHPIFLVIVPTDITSTGGSVVRPMKIARIIASRWQTRLFSYRFHKMGIAPWKSLLLAPYWFMSLLLTLVKTRFDCVYFYIDRYGFVIAYILKKLGIQNYKIVYEVLLTTHNKRKESLTTMPLTGLKRFAVQHADLVVVNSTRALNFFRQFNRNVELVSNFVLTKLPTTPRDEMRRKYQLDPLSVVVGLVGPFDNPNNRDDLRFLINNIAKFDSMIKFLIIGKVPASDKFACPNVTYAGFVLDYVSHLAMLDCILIPRRLPPDGIVDGAMNRAVEAASLGIPVFVTPVGLATLEYNTAGKDIFVFDLEDLPQKINEIVLDRSRLVEVGHQARATYEEHYAKGCGKLLEILDRLLVTRVRKATSE